MASLVSDKNGTFRVTWMHPDGRHKTVRLGRITRTQAKEMKSRIETLVAVAKTGMAIDPLMTAWLNSLTDEIHGKLSATGLVAVRASDSLGHYLETYRARRVATKKPASVVVFDTIRNDMLAFFDADTPLRAMTPTHAEEYYASLHTRGKKLAAYTIARRMTAIKSIFAAAVRQELIPVNPFRNYQAKYSAPKQKHYVSVEDTEKILAHCSPRWRMIVALSRYAGLRCPSEVLSLKWESINLPAGRMVVSSPKTEHIDGKDERVVPIFTRLRPHLEEAFEAAAEQGAEYVVSGRESAMTEKGWVNCNLRTTMTKIVRRAGLAPWPKLFNSFRASCETDLCEEFPGHVVCEWIGHDALISRRHYTQVLESHFAKAAQNAAQLIRDFAELSGIQRNGM